MTVTTSLIRDQQIFFDKYNLTTQSNSVNIGYSANMLKATVLGNDTDINTPGLKSVTVGIAGLSDAATLDAGMFAEIAGSSAPLTISATSSPGALAYLLKSVAGKYDQSGKVGDLLSFNFDLNAADKLVRGTLCENQSAFTTTAHGTARQLGAVSASQSLYAHLHVFSVSGTNPTLDLNITSNSTNSFGGTETTRGTAVQVTAASSQVIKIAGAITDTWWCPEFIVGGTGSPTFAFILAMGIQ